MKLEAYAKVNLTLEVLGVRPDGYHLIRSVLLPVSLSDTIELKPFHTITSDVPFADDLCIKVARDLAERAAWEGRGIALKGVAIHVEKRIPVGGGLGGGSADAAAVLVGLNELWQCGYTREQLAQTGAAAGSDVPALVMGGAVLMEGRGEIVTKIESPKTVNFVLLSPQIGCSTKKIYERSRFRLTNDPKIVYNVRQSLVEGDWKMVEAALVNDLQEPAIEVVPEVGAALDVLKAAGIERPQMSGSGSTVFGLVPDETRGRKIAAFLTAQGLRAWAVHSIVP